MTTQTCQPTDPRCGVHTVDVEWFEAPSVENTVMYDFAFYAQGGENKSCNCIILSIN